MQGDILLYNKKVMAGLISGDDGVRYEFATADWLSKRKPIQGVRVDFDTEGKVAQKIMLLQRRTAVANKWTYIFLAVILGWMGAHNFYVGKTAEGWIDVFFFWTGAPLIMAVLGILEVLFMGRDKFDLKFNY